MPRRCPACRSTQVRRSGTYPYETSRHPFQSPYRCLECDARFWVTSRRTRTAIAAIGVLAVSVIVGFGVARLAVEAVGPQFAATAGSAPADAKAGEAPRAAPATAFDLQTGSPQMSAPSAYPAVPMR
jgi:hypothetical protein